MKVGVIGTGNMGKALVTLLEQGGHEVVVGSRGVAGSILTAARAPVVFLAVPYAGALELVQDKAFGDALGSNVLVDMVNALTPDFKGITVGFSDSAAEQIARHLPRARVVKALNTIFADVLVDHAANQAKSRVGGKPLCTFVASDSAEGKILVQDLLKGLGFDPLDMGPLSNARFLEPAVQLVIELGYRQSRGSHIALGISETGV